MVLSQGYLRNLCNMQVLLVSAQDAMLSRLILLGKAGREERLRFGNLAFGSRHASSVPDEEYMKVQAPTQVEASAEREVVVSI